MNTDLSSPDGPRRRLYESPWWKLAFNLPGVIVSAGLVIAMLVLGAAVSREGTFTTPANLGSISFIWLGFAMLVPANVLIIAEGGLDLSLGSVIGLTTVLVATWTPALGLLPAAIAALGVALLAGLVNGLLAGGTRIHGAVVTLGTATLLRGLAYLISQGRTQPLEAGGFLVSPLFPWAGLAIALVLGIPLALVWQSRPSAHGSEVGESWLEHLFYSASPYILSSFMAGLVGLVTLGRLRASSPIMGTGIEITVLLAALLGGTPLANLRLCLGIVNMLGALLAALVLAVFQDSLLLSGMQITVMDMIKGAVILFVALTSYLYYLLLSRISARQVMTSSPQAPTSTPV